MYQDGTRDFMRQEQLPTPNLWDVNRYLIGTHLVVAVVWKGLFAVVILVQEVEVVSGTVPIVVRVVLRIVMLAAEEQPLDLRVTVEWQVQVYAAHRFMGVPDLIGLRVIIISISEVSLVWCRCR